MDYGVVNIIYCGHFAGGPALADREEPSVPTGVRIDQAKVTQWSNDLVRFTDNFPTEKLERVYSAMNKVRLLFSQLLNFSQLGCFKNHFCLFFIINCSYTSR